MVTSLARLIKHVDDNITTATHGLDTFKAELEHNPVGALEWADKRFEAVASLQVWSQVKKMLATAGAPGPEGEAAVIALVNEEAIAQVVNYRGPTSRSSSTCSNLMEDGRHAAWCKVVRTIGM